MQDLIIQGTEETPDVKLSASEGVFKIEGFSLPEDGALFYTPIITWFKEYEKSPNDKTCLDFKIKYFNTASSKFITDIMVMLETMKDNGHEVIINWYCDENDEEMLEAGDEFKEIIDVPVHILHL